MHRLAELNPEWLSAGPGRTGMGIGFECPEHGASCRLHVWFLCPKDGDSPITVGPGMKLHAHSGDTFDTLEVVGTIVHGDRFLFVHDGNVAST